jgi:predicted DCC family thiol-disulfide oxidoreductase YuxK
VPQGTAFFSLPITTFAQDGFAALLTVPFEFPESGVLTLSLLPASLPSMNLTVFYDASCPLCSVEMKHLKRHDTDGRITLENIKAPDFAQRFPEINPQAANALLHGQWRNGEMLYGLDVTYHAWRLVGKGFWVTPLRWRLLWPLWDVVYRLFARYRQPLSRALFRQEGSTDQQPPGSCRGQCPTRLRRNS